MFVIREKNSHKILHRISLDHSLDLKPEDIYSAFDAETMELLKASSEKIPTFYKVDDSNYIIEKTTEEKLFDGDVDFQHMFDPAVIHAEESAANTGGSTEQQDWVDFVLSENLISNLDKAQCVLIYLGAKLEKKISKLYTPAQELKNTKAYLDWQQEGQPEDDNREARYKKMQQNIAEIKEKMKPKIQAVKDIRKQHQTS